MIVEIWGNKKLERPGTDPGVLRRQIRGILATPGPTANGRVYSANIMRREIERLNARLKKTPLLELTERVFNDDYDPEVEHPDLAADISRQIREALPNLPRFTITKLKFEDGSVIINVAFDAPIRPGTIQKTPISISARGRIKEDGTVETVEIDD